MTALFHLLSLRSLLILAVLLTIFPALSAQEAEETTIQTKKKSSKTAQTSAQKAALEAEKNTNNLRKINLLLSIAQDRDRQAGEDAEVIHSRRMRLEEDLADAEDNPKNLSKKERADLDAELKAVQKKEKVAQNTRKLANNFLLDVTQALEAEPSKKAKFLENYERKHGPVNDSKMTEIGTSDAVLTTTDRQAKSLSVAEKSKKSDEDTPSVQTPISRDNAVENTADARSVPSKAKKEKKPKKVVEKAPKKKAKKEETPKTKEEFPLVLTEARTTPVVEPTIENAPTTPVGDSTIENAPTPVVESSKGKKTTSKKLPKIKWKKGAKPAESTATKEDFPLILTETTTPPTEQKAENTNTNPSETITPSEPSVENLDVKKGKKPTKNDKKAKRRSADTPEPTLVSYKTYDRKADVFMNTPTPECALAYDGKDDFTGKMKRETSPKRFFAHTDDALRKALLDKEFITCDITGTKIESSRYTYLNLTFTILSKDIQRSIGFLDKGTPIIFVLVNGSKVTLRTNKTDIGVVDIDKGTTTYRAQLTVESVTDITDSELDYIRVNWSSGYEDYEIFDVDIMKNLFNCLYKK